MNDTNTKPDPTPKPSNDASGGCSGVACSSERFDENSIEHNDMPPLALSDWQRFDDPDGMHSVSFQRDLEEAEYEDSLRKNSQDRPLPKA